MTDVPDTVSSQDDLLLIQREFFRIIRKPLQHGTRMYEDDVTPLFVKPNGVLSAHERLELYAQQYWWRVLRVMRTDFRRVRLFLGDRTFTDIVMAYLDRYPSTYPQLKLLGREFARFIETSQLLSESERSIASDIAAVEMASLEVSRAARIPSLSIETLLELGEAVKIMVQPFVRSVRLSYSVDCLFNEVCEIEDGQELGNGSAYEIDEPESDTDSSVNDMTSCDYSIAVYRSHEGVRICVLDEIDRDLLLYLRHARKLQDVCDEVSRRLFKLGNVDDVKFQQLFAQFARRGWLGIVEE